MFDLPLLAGAISSGMFVIGTLPMIYKAFATRNLQSYSLLSLLVNNLGNLLHALYVYSLPFGPIWLLHGFNLITTALMLLWYVRYESGRKFTGGLLQSLRTNVIRNAVALVKPSRSPDRPVSVGNNSLSYCC